MDILKRIEGDLNNHYHDNTIYFFNENEKDTYEKVKDILDEDYGYLDIVLDFKDYDKLNTLFEQSDIIKHIIINDYLNYCILRGANIDTLDSNISISEIGEYLFGGDASKYISCDSLYFYFDVYDHLIEKAKTTKNKKCRIHFLLDNVTDIDLQKCINDFISYRCDVAMMCYTTKNLLTHCTTNNNFIENVHDYMSVESDEREKVLKKKWEGMII